MTKATIRERNGSYAVRLGLEHGRAECVIGTNRGRAEQACRHMSALADYHAADEAVPVETLRWVDRQPDRIRRWLAKHDLVDSARVAGSEPLAALLDTFIGDTSARMRRGKPVTEKRLKVLRDRLARMFDAMAITTWRQVTVEAARQALSQLRDQGKAPRTVAGHCQALKQFGAWMQLSPRNADDQLKELRPSDYNSDESEKERRAYDGEELAYLIAHVARHGHPVRRGMPAGDRALLYQVGAELGLRASEIQSLSAGSFDLSDTERPVVRVAATATKNGRTKVLPGVARPQNIAQIHPQPLQQLLPVGDPEVLDQPLRDRIDRPIVDRNPVRLPPRHSLQHTITTRLL